MRKVSLPTNALRICKSRKHTVLIAEVQKCGHESLFTHSNSIQITHSDFSILGQATRNPPQSHYSIFMVCPLSFFSISPYATIFSSILVPS